MHKVTNQDTWQQEAHGPPKLGMWTYGRRKPCAATTCKPTRLGWRQEIISHGQRIIQSWFPDQENTWKDVFPIGESNPGPSGESLVSRPLGCQAPQMIWGEQSSFTDNALKFVSNWHNFYLFFGSFLDFVTDILVFYGIWPLLLRSGTLCKVVFNLGLISCVLEHRNDNSMWHWLEMSFTDLEKAMVSFKLYLPLPPEDTNCIMGII